MKKLFLIVAATGMSVSAASACEYQKSVQTKIDETTVASISSMSQPTTEPATLEDNGDVLIKEKATE